MTRKDGDRSLAEIKAIAEEESDFLRPMVRAVIQEFLESRDGERRSGRQNGERVEGRLSYRSGYYTRSLVTRVGKLELRVPQDRNGRFSTEIFERYQRSEKALVAALTRDVHPRAYRRGRSRRSAKSSADTSFSASAISEINKKLDAELGHCARRELESEYPYLIIDARYERLRENGGDSFTGSAGGHRD